MKVSVHLVGAALGAALIGGAANATIIDVQFGGIGAQTGAAVVGSAGDYWNQYSATSVVGGAYLNQNPNVTGAALMSSANSATGLSLSYSALGSYTSSTGNNTAFANTSNYNLMRGYLYANKNGVISATISGLTAGQSFTLYLYSQKDSAYTGGRKETFTVNGFASSITNSNASTFIQNDNYSMFTGTANANGQIVIAATSTSSEIDLNGLQLITATNPGNVTTGVPETATWAMMAIGFGAMGGAMRRRRSDRSFA